jgi:hypothetical protein
MAAGFDDFSFCAVSGSDLPLDSGKPSSVFPVHFIRQISIFAPRPFANRGLADAEHHRNRLYDSLDF